MLVLLRFFFSAV
uniref:Uncharacterized protein n=1 Tax=Arundo donax TaxID=35708 RepID=A0A0A8ZDK0_ARUDO